MDYDSLSTKFVDVGFYETKIRKCHLCLQGLACLGVLAQINA